MNKISSKINHIFKNVKMKQRLPSSKKIILGSSSYGAGDDWVCSDIDVLNVTKHSDFSQFWSENSLTAFLAEHVWEHLTAEEAKAGLENCFAFLEKGGRIRLAVPDGLFPDRDYIEHVRPNGTLGGDHGHQVLYTYKSLGDLMQSIGFDVQLLEYWDENENFQYIAWSSEDGHVRRSRFNDARNSADEIKYTSIIVDGIKP